MGLVGLGTWFLTGQALAPLATVTATATRITQADDPAHSPSPNSGDGGGKLIRAFNETLELQKSFNPTPLPPMSVTNYAHR
jgi:hypothetical protein